MKFSMAFEEVFPQNLIYEFYHLVCCQLHYSKWHAIAESSINYIILIPKFEKEEDEDTYHCIVVYQ